VNVVPLAAIKGGRAVELAWHTEEGKEVKGVDFNIGSGAYPWLTLSNFLGYRLRSPNFVEKGKQA
jgi:hypothetical protein